MVGTHAPAVCTQLIDDHAYRPLNPSHDPRPKPLLFVEEVVVPALLASPAIEKRLVIIQPGLWQLAFWMSTVVW